jgi:Ca-activated chloride channel family protein
MAMGLSGEPYPSAGSLFQPRRLAAAQRSESTICRTMARPRGWRTKWHDRPRILVVAVAGVDDVGHRGIARPQWIGEPIELPNTGRDLMLGLDLSGSMQIEDMQIGSRLVPRITAVKAIAADFTQRRQGDRVGLILFGTRAYLQAPLTFDLDTVTRFIEEAQLGFAGEDTAIGDALGLAIKRLRERPAASRIFILLTDGQDTASTVDPMEAAALASQLDVKIYTIGISRNLGRSSRARVEVDEAMLNAVAEATGGRYFRATSPAELEAVYALLDELEPVEQAASTFRPRRALSWIPLLVAMGLTALLALLRSGWLSQLFARPSYG